MGVAAVLTPLLALNLAGSPHPGARRPVAGRVSGAKVGPVRTSPVTTPKSPAAPSAAAPPPTVVTTTTAPPTTTAPKAGPVTSSTTLPVMPAAAEVAPTATTTTAPAPTVATTAPVPGVAVLVSEVEADGIDPGPNWSWSMGDTASRCGAIPDPGIGTGCTSGAAGAATTVFAGSPTLSLVAHELANAETENDAVPSLVTEVTDAEAGSSWSPIDAVASCLVEHFMGFQDHAAGPWLCPAALSSVVAARIHDGRS
jgi:hypothetical protein